MSAEDYIICPHCGKENLIQASRCIHCKEHLDIIPASAAEMAANEEDITEMLSAMDEEKDAFEVSAPVDNPGSLMPEGSNSQNAKSEDKKEEELPGWLTHVRQRAQTEGDAQGLYNRNSTSLPNQKTLNRESLDQPFNSWVGRVHADQAGGENPKGEAQNVKSDEIPVWLKRVRDLQLQPDENTVQKPTGVDAWKQEWSEEDLERLKNGEFDEKPVLQPSLLDQANVPDQKASAKDVEKEAATERQSQADLEVPKRSVVMAAAESKLVDTPAGVPHEAYEENAEEKPVEPTDDQAGILKEIVGAESKPQFRKATPKPKKTDIWRWVGIIFLLVMLLAFYLLFLNRPAPAPLGNASGTAFWNRLDALQPSSNVLIILDYQASTSDEMEANLAPVMTRLKEKDTVLSLVALWPDGLWLGRELLDQASLAPETAVQYLPGGSLAMLSSAADLMTADASSGSQSNFIGSNLALKETDLILYAADNPDSAKTWIEQVGSFLQPEQCMLVSTQAAQVLLQPYYDSNQIAGLSILPYRADGSLMTGDPRPAATPAFEAGMGVMAGFLTLSFIGKVLKTDKNKNDEDGRD
jgi:hypothetical protein